MGHKSDFMSLFFLYFYFTVTAAVMGSGDGSCGPECIDTLPHSGNRILVSYVHHVKVAVGDVNVARLHSEC